MMPFRREIIKSLPVGLAVKKPDGIGSVVQNQSTEQWSQKLDSYNYVKSAERIQKGIQALGSVKDSGEERPAISEFGTNGKPLESWNGTGKHIERIFGALKSSSGGNLICGRAPVDTPYRVSVLSIDKEGKTRWANEYPKGSDPIWGLPIDGALASFPKNDTTCLAWTSANSDYSVYYVVGIGPDGNELWQHQSESLSSVVDLVTMRDGIGLIGRFNDVYTVRKYASDGEMRRSARLPFRPRTGYYDDSILVAGTTNWEPGPPLSVIRLDGDFNVSWQYDADIFDPVDHVGNFVPCETGYCLAVGGEIDGEKTFKILTIDSEDGITVTTTFRGSPDQAVRHVVPLNGTEFIAIEEQNNQYWIKRYGEMGKGSPTVTKRKGTTAANRSTTQSTIKRRTTESTTDGIGDGFGIVAGLLSLGALSGLRQQSSNDE